MPAWLTGTFERLLAFAIFYAAPTEAYTVFIAWILAKLAANWQRRGIDKLDPEDERKIRAQTLIALKAGTLSLAIGVIGATVARSYPRIVDLDSVALVLAALYCSIAGASSALLLWVMCSFPVGGFVALAALAVIIKKPPGLHGA